MRIAFNAILGTKQTTETIGRAVGAAPVAAGTERSDRAAGG